MPLVRGAIFTGRVTSAAAESLSLGAAGEGVAAQLQSAGPCYVEILSGALEGHRIEVDTADSSGTTVKLNLSASRSTVHSLDSAALTNARIAVRPHWKLAEIFPVSLFHAGTDAATADRLMFFDSTTNAYIVHWLQVAGSSAKWVLEGDVSGADTGSRILEPGEGLVVQPRTAPVILTLVGEVRSGKFARPLVSGTQLIGNGYPAAMSPADKGMSAANGFAASASPASADRLRVWRGDAEPGVSGYVSHFLLQSGSAAFWTKEGDAATPDESSSDLFGAWRAVFLVRPAAMSNHVESAPVAP